MLALSPMTSLANPVYRNLVCHPRTLSRSIAAIDVRVDSATRGILTLTFVLQGDLATLPLPWSARAGRWNSCGGIPASRRS